MCEPRRIEVTVTRQVREAWEREVERVAEVAGTVTGEARIVQPLDVSVGESALRALHAALSRGVPGWAAVAGGYRHDVPGGYIVYHPEARTLEIVAALTETMSRRAVARDRLSGVIEDDVAVQGIAGYYSDGWGGHTAEVAEAEARRNAERALPQALRQRIDDQAAAAEGKRAAALVAEATAAARRNWDEAAEQRRAALSAQAAAALLEVGTRGRQAANRLLAVAYRDAFLALARRRGVAADAIHQRETADILEIEFILPD